ncbi:unnamed protein product [Protopolystoma xenopodis]|uniref:EGF-like domain-containing protein n=1 Tax=Protopolystoma xenopodis TaxID=117903 RepID=A0A3S5A1D2_9PLAT|nr:unnamed protein product [Protopolystoma xenopodis]
MPVDPCLSGAACHNPDAVCETVWQSANVSSPPAPPSNGSTGHRPAEGDMTSPVTGLLVGFRCHCPAGFVGPTCEESVDACQQHNCRNGATCFNRRSAGYVCLCPTGELSTDVSLWPADRKHAAANRRPSRSTDFVERTRQPTEMPAKRLDLVPSWNGYEKGLAAVKMSVEGRTKVRPISSGNERASLVEAFASKVLSKPNIGRRVAMSHRLVESSTMPKLVAPQRCARINWISINLQR